MTMRKILIAALLLLSLSSGFALPKIACAGLSAILPGSGEIALGKYNRATIMISTDLIAWTAFLDTKRDISNLRDTYKIYAQLKAGASLAGDDNYFQNLQNYLSSTEFNEYHEMMARNYYMIYMPDGIIDQASYDAYIAENTYADSLAWAWKNTADQKKYRSIRSDYQAARLNHNLSLGILILNRAISLIDVAFIKPEGRPQALYFSPAEDAGLMLNYRLDF